jgi:hypothetical protein
VLPDTEPQASRERSCLLRIRSWTSLEKCFRMSLMVLSTAMRWLTTAQTFSRRAFIFTPPEIKSTAWDVCRRYL